MFLPILITEGIWIGIPILLPHRFHKFLSLRKYVAWFWLFRRGSFVDTSNFLKFDTTHLLRMRYRTLYFPGRCTHAQQYFRCSVLDFVTLRPLNMGRKLYIPCARHKKWFSLYMHAKPLFAYHLYRQRKWLLPASVRKVMTLGRKLMALGCQVFHCSVKCSKHGLRGFIDGVQHRLATQTVTMLTSCWQVLSDVELRRIFDICKRWANSNFACICKEKYCSIHEATRAIRLLIVWKSSTYPQPWPYTIWPKYTILAK